MAMAIQLASSASRTSPTPTHDGEGGRSTSSPGSSSTTMGDISIGSVGSGTSGYQCIQCPLSFQNRDQLEKHEVTTHDHLNHSPNSSGIAGNANQVRKFQIFFQRIWIEIIYREKLYRIWRMNLHF